MLDATQLQILEIQACEIVKYLMNKVMMDNYNEEDITKIQKMFNIIKGNGIDYGIKETNSDR
jgi:hypothetical protein